MLYTDICPIFFDLIECANWHIGWLVGWSANWHIGWCVSGGAMLKLAGVHPPSAVGPPPPPPTPTPTPLSKNAFRFWEAIAQHGAVESL